MLTPDDTAIAVAFGDSWFEGVGSTTGANNRSVDFLNRRLKRGWVLNQGIAGNRLLLDEVGEHAPDTFDAVFDVARAVEDPEAPDYIHPALDGGDGMHLNDKGAQAMADAVDLETLTL